MSDQRRHKRRLVDVEFRCDDLGPEYGAKLNFASADISAGGAFLISDALFERGQQLTLEFSVPGKFIRAEAEVAWVRRFPDSNQDAGMGVSFSLRDEDRIAIEAFVSEE